jgi:hypothetical protein
MELRHEYQVLKRIETKKESGFSHYRGSYESITKFIYIDWFLTKKEALECIRRQIDLNGGEYIIQKVYMRSNV